MSELEYSDMRDDETIVNTRYRIKYLGHSDTDVYQSATQHSMCEGSNTPGTPIYSFATTAMQIENRGLLESRVDS